MKNRNISLHIDDGSMGGGGPVPHEDVLTWEEWCGYGTPDYPTGGLYDQYFTHERKGIFHYCIFCHDGDHGEVGAGIPGGDTFIICDAVCFVNKVNAFIHELGHNILGDGSTAAPYGGHRDGDGHHNYEWWESKDCAMHWENCNAETYCSKCWKDLDLDYCI